MTTDTSEKGLETLIVEHMTGSGWLSFGMCDTLRSPPHTIQG